MPSQELAGLVSLVEAEREALRRNDWARFQSIYQQVESILSNLAPREEDASELRALLTDFDLIASELETKHRITGALIRDLGARLKRTGQVIDGRF